MRFSEHCHESVIKRVSFVTIIYFLLFFSDPQSYSDPGDVKVSQASQMLGPKPPMFPGAGQTHPGLYMGPPYHQQASLNSHLPPSLRGCPPRPNASMPGSVGMRGMTTTPPPLQISPPLHQHLSLHQQQQLSSHPLPLHSPSMAQVSPHTHRIHTHT